MNKIGNNIELGALKDMLVIANVFLVNKKFTCEIQEDMEGVISADEKITLINKFLGDIVDMSASTVIEDLATFCNEQDDPELNCANIMKIELALRELIDEKCNDIYEYLK